MFVAWLATLILNETSNIMTITHLSVTPNCCLVKQLNIQMQSKTCGDYHPLFSKINKKTHNNYTHENFQYTHENFQYKSAHSIVKHAQQRQVSYKCLHSALIVIQAMWPNSHALHIVWYNDWHVFNIHDTFEKVQT